ncbi:hypothetical protein [Ramlibacter sp. 2FC]|uniref:hypothetical protein n=1 Tax=Ramlibacter sp. 2FC TaxID=2502188 RepID=UPI0010F790C5|nr:hypothetical protein [Ramlibacter sp. 2FC]
MSFESLPVFVEVRARADSESGECFGATAKQVAEHDGSCVYGWLIWEWPGILIEAEFHAVWQQPNGTLLDVAKKDDGESVVLFLPDPSKSFEGVRVDSIRLPIGKNPAIKTLIAGKERFYRLFQQKHGNATGHVVLDGDLADLHDQLAVLSHQLSVSREAIRGWSLFSRKQRLR